MCSIGVSECVQTLHLPAVFISILVLKTDLENFVLCSCVGVRNEVAIKKKRQREKKKLVSFQILYAIIYCTEIDIGRKY